MPSIVSIDINIAFAMDGNMILLLIAEIFLSAAAVNLARSKKQRDKSLRSTVPLPPFLTEAKILEGEMTAEEILNIFARSITERVDEGEDDDEDEGKRIQ